MKFENVFAKLKKSLGKKGLGIVAVGLLAGVFLLLMPESEKKEDISEKDNNLTSVEYCSRLEQKAEALICEMPEVDHCEVFITLERGFRYTYATDQHVREESSGKQTDKTIVLADNGNGESPILIEETMPTVAGVAVVCKNASYETQYRIIELMCALFDIKSNRISIQT